MKIGVFGQKGTFCEVAARRYKDGVELVFFDLITNLFNSLDNDEIQKAIIPFENNYNGTIGESLNYLYNSNFQITKEIIIPMHFVLAGKSEKYNQIASHSMIIDQCSNFIDNEKIIITTSTSEAMKLASDNRLIAAIGTELASEMYGLKVLKDNICNKKNNITRFVVIEKEPLVIDGYKTSLAILSDNDRVGLLFDILKIFKTNKINLTKIESRLYNGKTGSYLFFMDIEGNIKEDNLKNSINEIKKLTKNVKVFGSYDSIY